MPMNRSEYPPDWADISLVRRAMAGWVCEECGADQGQPHPITGSRVVLTVAHLDHNRHNNAADNLRVLCQRCHFAHDRWHNITVRRRNRKLRSMKAGQEEMDI